MPMQQPSETHVSNFTKNLLTQKDDKIEELNKQVQQLKDQIWDAEQ